MALGGLNGKETVFFECSGSGSKMLYSGSLGSKNVSKFSFRVLEIFKFRENRHAKLKFADNVDFLEILNISRTRHENFDKFFDPNEPEYNIFEPIPEH